MARFDFRILTTPIKGEFKPEDKLPKFLERMRWLTKIRCPHCPSYRIKQLRFAWNTHDDRYVYLCHRCRCQFTVTTGTALHHTHVPLAKWLDAIALRENQRRKVTAAQLVRHLGVTHKTALLMCARLRQGMREPLLRNLAAAIRLQRSWDRIYRNLFPALYEESAEPAPPESSPWRDIPLDSSPSDGAG